MTASSATTTSSAPLVEMRDVSRAFGGVQAVDGVSIDLHAGEVLGLLGHNGAGKSSLISILAGATGMDTGEILVNGQAVSINSPKEARDQGIETLYQNLALADNLNAAGNLFLGREMKKFGVFRDTRRMREDTKDVLAQINPRFTNLSAAAGTLSGGQRQSIAIARAVYFNARVLIMDEPTAALGPAETALFKELVGRLTDRGVGVILISHDIHDVFELADRLVVMADGRVVGRLNTRDATKDQVLEMIIMGGAKDPAPSLVELVDASQTPSGEESARADR